MISLRTPLVVMAGLTVITIALFGSRGALTAQPATVHASAVQPAAITSTCTSVSACLSGLNLSSGNGVYGSSAKGRGVFGQGQTIGVSGYSYGGVGITASSTTGLAINARATSNAIVAATNNGCASIIAGGCAQFPILTNSYAAITGATALGGAGILGIGGQLDYPNFGNGIGNAPAYGGYFTSGGVGVYAEGDGLGSGNVPSIYGFAGEPRDGLGVGVAANADEAMSANGFIYGLATESDSGTAVEGISSSGYVFRGSKPNDGGDVAQIDANGNMVLAGNLTVNGTPGVVLTNTDGTSSMAYLTRATQATLEDVGEAQMQAGRAHVPIDANLARSIDASRGYLVFLTPQAQTAGVYVTAKTTRGFTIAETGSAHSSIPVDYRIVVSTSSAPSARLPAVRNHAIAIVKAKRPIFVTGKMYVSAKK